MSKDIMTVREVADYLGFGVTKIYKLIEAREIPASKIGRQYRFLKAAVDTWLVRNIISEDREFLALIKDVREDFVNAGYTQADIDKTLEKIR